MKKIDFNKKLNKKQTIIAIMSIACFVLLGIVGAILGNVLYLDSQEAKVVNYSSSNGSSLRMKNNGSLVYVYKDTTAINLSDVLELSKGATLKVIRVETTPDKESLPPQTEIDPSVHPHVNVFLQVKSKSGKKTTDYLLEIVSEKEYRPDEKIPPLIEEGKNDDSNLLK